MDHTPTPAPDGEQLETLLRQTFVEQAATVAAPPDTLARLNAHLDAASPLKRWLMPLRLAGAVAVALLLLALFTPVGRLAAAGAHNATQTIITTVKQIASGNSTSDTLPRQGTAAAPNATTPSASDAAPTQGAGSPVTNGTVNPALATRAGTASSVAPLSPAPTPRATDQPTITGTVPGTARPSPSAVSTATISPASTLPPATAITPPTPTAKGP